MQFTAARSVLTVNGGLRTGIPIDDLSVFGIQEKIFLFVDDSFYRGRTRDTINDELVRCGASLARTLVIYDGSKDVDPTVQSLYRYHDMLYENDAFLK